MSSNIANSYPKNTILSSKKESMGRISAQAGDPVAPGCAGEFNDATSETMRSGIEGTTYLHEVFMSVSWFCLRGVRIGLPLKNPPSGVSARITRAQLNLSLHHCVCSWVVYLTIIYRFGGFVVHFLIGCFGCAPLGGPRATVVIFRRPSFPLDNVGQNCLGCILTRLKMEIMYR